MLRAFALLANLFAVATRAIGERDVKQHDHGSHRYIGDCLHHPISQIPHSHPSVPKPMCTINFAATTRISGSGLAKEICYAARALQRE